MQQHPLPTTTQTFERSLTGVHDGQMHWTITSESPRPRAARLEYVERRDGTVTITAIVVHPSATRFGMQRALLNALAAHHPSLLGWRLAPELAARAAGPSAAFWSAAARAHTVFLSDEDGYQIGAAA